MSRFNQCAVLILACLCMVFVILGCATTRPASDYDAPTKVVCPEGTNYMAGQCVSVCGRGQKWDSSNKGCVSVCGPGYGWNGYTCASLCLGETTWDGLNQTCVCPAGKFQTEMGRCLTSEELKCEEDKARKLEFERTAQLKAWIEAERARAKEAAPKCKAGTEWDMFTKQCISICRGGQWNDAQATCLCPQGFRWVPNFGECLEQFKPTN